MIKKIFSIGVLLFVFLMSFTYAQEIRVGLTYNQSIDTVVLKSDQIFQVIINGEDLRSLDAKIIKIKKDPNTREGVVISNRNNDVVFAYNSKDDIKIMTDGMIEYDGRRYRGAFLFARNSGSDLTVINVLDIEKYLYGVIPSEMPHNWPIEALKAQAISARNYAYANLGNYEELGFDVTDDINSQVYKGYSGETDKTSRAVDETYGQLLKYNDQLVVAYYHSNSGGQTESVENLWSAEVPYLRGVEDEFSKNTKNATWRREYSYEDIRSILSAAGYNLGKIYDVKILEKSDNNRVVKLFIDGHYRNLTLEKSEIRKTFGYNELRSLYFEVIKSDNYTYVTDQAYEEAPLNSMVILTANGKRKLSAYDQYTIYNGKEKKVVDIEKDLLVFDGKGYGHGIGMSQWGAYEMASRGYSYERILQHYYKSTYLEGEK